MSARSPGSIDATLSSCSSIYSSNVSRGAESPFLDPVSDRIQPQKPPTRDGSPLLSVGSAAGADCKFSLMQASSSAQRRRGSRRLWSTGLKFLVRPSPPRRRRSHERAPASVKCHGHRGAGSDQPHSGLPFSFNDIGESAIPRTADQQKERFDQKCGSFK